MAGYGLGSSPVGAAVNVSPCPHTAGCSGHSQLAE